MGQYYNPMTVKKVGEKSNHIIARPTKWMYSHDYGNGLKLMEHSWLRNTFVNTFAKTLLTGKPKRVVWAGDYADPEPNTDDINLYDFASDDKQIQPDELTVDEMDTFLAKYPYLCNYSRNEYVILDENKLPKDSDGWYIHPLPLLTAEGNGRGGGDFRGNNDYVGRWARDKIAFRTKPPKGFTEMKPKFME